MFVLSPRSARGFRDTLYSVGDDFPDEQNSQSPTTARLVLSAHQLDHELTGTLPCVSCGYELRGLSIRGQCPECGTAIRATILFKVDPKAEEFRPVVAPKLLAWSMVAWGTGALLAALTCWGLRARDFLGQFSSVTTDGPLISMLTVGMVVLSGLGTIAMIYPVKGTPVKHAAAAAIAAVAYVPLVWSLWILLVNFDSTHAAPYFEGTPNADRIYLRLIAGMSMIVVILGIRLNARDLVKRCMVMRTGRVDRQTLLAMVATIAVAMAGDGIRLSMAADAAGEMSLLAIMGSLLVALGSGLFTLGLMGAMIDTWRISRSILIPSPSLRQLISA